jgi:hypothetical protein
LQDSVELDSSYRLFCRFDQTVDECAGVFLAHNSRLGFYVEMARDRVLALAVTATPSALSIEPSIPV